jgi:hypothetical protein
LAEYSPIEQVMIDDFLMEGGLQLLLQKADAASRSAVSGKHHREKRSFDRVSSKSICGHLQLPIGTEKPDFL